MPFVRFVSPDDGATVPNPVTFTIEAAGVDEVQVFADETYAPGRGVGSGAAGHAALPLRRHRHPAATAAWSVASPASDVVRAELTLTIQPDSCEDRFFVSEFDARNTDPTGP